jgi:hypothetical protein
LIDFAESMNDIQFKQAAEEVATFFGSRDLLFERDEYGITVLIPGIDLDAGLDKAQKFSPRVKEKVLFKGDDSVFIGLTSRAGRLLEADRMMVEAGEALQRSKKERDTTIVAFKSDLEKYRKFIASQSPRNS